MSKPVSASQSMLLDLLTKKPIECPPNVADCGFSIGDDLDVILDLSTSTRRTVKIIVSVVFLIFALFCLFSSSIGIFVITRVYKRYQTAFYLFITNLLVAGCFLSFHFIGMAYPTFLSAFFNTQLNYTSFRNFAFHTILQYIGAFVHQLILWTLLVIMMERVTATIGMKYFERRFSCLAYILIWVFSIVSSVPLNIFKCGYYGGSFRDTERSFRCFAIQDKKRWYWIEMVVVNQILFIDLVCTVCIIFLVGRSVFSLQPKKPNIQTKHAIVVFLIYEITILIGLVRNYTIVNPIHSLRGMVDLRNFTAYDIFKTLEELIPILNASLLLCMLTVIPIYLYFSSRKLLFDRSPHKNCSKCAGRVGSATSVSMVYMNIANAPRKSVICDKSVMVY